MKKHAVILFALAVLCLCLGLWSGTGRADDVATQGYCGGEGDGTNLTWALNVDEGVLTICGSGSMANMGSGAPWYEQRENIRSVIIEDGVTNIGVFVFNGCTALTSVSIPESVTSIEFCAFQSCRSLITLIIPESISVIGEYAFNRCDSLTSLTIPEGVVFLGIGAFDQCHSLKSVCIPGNVSEITGNPFGYCRNLAEILVAPTNVHFIAMDGVLFNAAKDQLIGYPAGKSDARYSIPEGVISVGDAAFCGCHNLMSVTFPSSVTEIGWDAFVSCGLTSITIPENVTAIVEEVFAHSRSLAVIALPETITQIDRYAFDGCDALTDVYYGGTLEQWEAIAKKENGNNALFSATLHTSTYPIPEFTPSIVVHPGDGDMLNYEVQHAPADVILIYAAYAASGKMEKIEFLSSMSGSIENFPVCKFFLLDAKTLALLCPPWSSRNVS